jgi:hypothetical protein
MHARQNTLHSVHGSVETRFTHVMVLTIHGPAVNDMQFISETRIPTFSKDSQLQLGTLSLWLHVAKTVNNVARALPPYSDEFKVMPGYPVGKFKNHRLPTQQEFRRRRGRDGEEEGGGGGGGEDEVPPGEEPSASKRMSDILTPGTQATEAVYVLMEYVLYKDGFARPDGDTGFEFVPTDIFAATADFPGISMSRVAMVRFYFVFTSDVALESFKKSIHHQVRNNASVYTSDETSKDVILNCIPQKDRVAEPMAFTNLCFRIDSPMRLQEAIRRMSFRDAVAPRLDAGTMLLDTFSPATIAAGADDRVEHISFDDLRPDRVIPAQFRALFHMRSTCFPEQFDAEAYGLANGRLDAAGAATIRWQGNTCFRLPPEFIPPHVFATMTWNVQPLPDLTPADVVTFMIQCAVEANNRALALCISEIAKVSPLIVVGIFFLTFLAPQTLLARHETVVGIRASRLLQQEAVSRRVAERLGRVRVGPAAGPASSQDDDDEDGDLFAGMASATLDEQRNRHSVDAVALNPAAVVAAAINDAVDPAKTPDVPIPPLFVAANILALSRGDIHRLRTAKAEKLPPWRQGSDQEVAPLLASAVQQEKITAIRIGQVGPMAPLDDAAHMAPPRIRRRIGDRESHHRVGDAEDDDDDEDDDDASARMRARGTGQRRRVPHLFLYSSLGMDNDDDDDDEDGVVADTIRRERDAVMRGMTLDNAFKNLTSVVCTQTGRLIQFPAFQHQSSYDTRVKRTSTLARIAHGTAMAIGALNIDTQPLQGLPAFTQWNFARLDEFMEAVSNAQVRATTDYLPNKPFLDMVHRMGVMTEASVMSVKRSALITAIKGNRAAAIDTVRSVVKRQLRSVRTAYESQAQSVHYPFLHMLEAITRRFKDVNARRMERLNPRIALTDTEFMGPLGDTIPQLTDATCMSDFLRRAYLAFERTLRLTQDHSILMAHLFVLPPVMDTSPGAMTPQIIMEGPYSSGKSMMHLGFTKCTPPVLCDAVSYSTACRDTGLKQTMHIVVRDDAGPTDFGMENGKPTKAAALDKEKATMNVIAVSAYQKNDDGTRSNREQKYPVYEASTTATNCVLRHMMDPAQIDRRLVISSGRETRRLDGREPTNDTDTAAESEAFKQTGRMFQFITSLASVVYTAIRAGLPGPNNLAALPLLQRLVAEMRERKIEVSSRTVKRIYGTAKYISIVHRILVLLSKQADFLAFAESFDMEATLDAILSTLIITEEAIRQAVAMFLPHLMDTRRQELVATIVTIMLNSSNKTIATSVAIDPHTHLPIPDYLSISLPETSSAKNIVEFVKAQYSILFRRLADFGTLLEECMKRPPDTSITMQNARIPAEIRASVPKGLPDELAVIQVLPDGRMLVNTAAMTGKEQAGQPMISMPLAAILTMASRNIIGEADVAARYEGLIASHDAMFSPSRSFPRGDIDASPRVATAGGNECADGANNGFSVISPRVSTPSMEYPGLLREAGTPRAMDGGSAGNGAAASASNSAGLPNVVGGAAVGGRSSDAAAGGPSLRIRADGTAPRAGSATNHAPSPASRVRGAASAAHLEPAKHWACLENPAILVARCHEVSNNPHAEKRPTELLIHCSIFNGTECASQMWTAINQATRGRHEDPRPVVYPLATEGKPDVPIIRRLHSNPEAEEYLVGRTYGGAQEWMDTEFAQADADERDDAAPGDGNVFVNEQLCDLNPHNPIDILFAHTVEPAAFNDRFPAGTNLENLAYEAAALAMGKRTRDDDGKPLPIITLAGRPYTCEDMRDLEFKIARAYDPTQRPVGIMRQQAALQQQETARKVHTTSFWNRLKRTEGAQCAEAAAGAGSEGPAVAAAAEEDPDTQFILNAMRASAATGRGIPRATGPSAAESGRLATTAAATTAAYLDTQEARSRTERASHSASVALLQRMEQTRPRHSIGSSARHGPLGELCDPDGTPASTPTMTPGRAARAMTPALGGVNPSPSASAATGPLDPQRLLRAAIGPQASRPTGRPHGLDGSPFSRPGGVATPMEDGCGGSQADGCPPSPALRTPSLF